MELTIGIPAYNAKNYLRRLLSSIDRELKKLPDELSYEVIVVDDASTDGTERVIPQEFPWIKFIRLEKNIGIARSTDIILEKMQGDYLLRLDADTQINATTVRELLKRAQKDPQIGALAPRLVDEKGNFQPSVETHFKHPLEWFLDYALWLKKLTQKLSPRRERVPSSRHSTIPVAYMASAAVLIPQKTIAAVGGIDPKMEFFMEDADWIWRINQAGWKVLYCPNLKLIHTGGQSGQLYIHTRDRSLKNLYYFYAKHRPGRLTPFLLALAILSGSFLSLLLAAGFYPVSLLNPHWEEIDRRARASFLNVFRWHLRKIR